MIAIDGIVVTEKMEAAGTKIASDAVIVNCSCQSDGKFDWSIYGPNGDILQRYHDNDLSAIELIYIAMERANDL